MEIKESNAMAAYNAADENGKKMLRALFPDMEWDEVCEGTKNDDRPVTERIKTFEDACKELGRMASNGDDTAGNILSDYESNADNILIPQTRAYMQLSIINYALNEGWEPQFTYNENRWYPWNILWTEEEISGKDRGWKHEHFFRSMEHHSGEWAGLAFARSGRAPSRSSSLIGSRLCFKSAELAEYAGKQFIDIWMDFELIRK